MAAVTVAIERVEIGDRHTVRVVRIVRVADEIDAAFDLWRLGTDEAGIRSPRVIGQGGLEGGHGAGATEIRVRVVDARVDHGDLDVFAFKGRRALPDQRSPDVGDSR